MLGTNVNRSSRNTNGRQADKGCIFQNTDDICTSKSNSIIYRPIKPSGENLGVEREQWFETNALWVEPVKGPYVGQSVSADDEDEWEITGGEFFCALNKRA